MYGITDADLDRIVEAPDVTALGEILAADIPSVQSSGQVRSFHLSGAHLLSAKEAAVGAVHAERLAEQGLAPPPQWRRLIVTDMTKMDWFVEAVGGLDNARKVPALTTTNGDMIFNATKLGADARWYLMYSMQENDSRGRRLGELGLGATPVTLHEITHTFDPKAAFLRAEHAARRDEAIDSMGRYSGQNHEAFAESGKMVFLYGAKAPQFAKDAWGMHFPMTPATWSAVTQAADNVRRSTHRLHASVDRDGHQLAPEAARQKHALTAALQGFTSVNQTTPRTDRPQVRHGAALGPGAQLAAQREAPAIGR
ncbi:MAG: hypothetical protein HOU01_15950 [Streptomycetaceae bacterium]|nr:hypothetical protein [Streptomycetaceae bacterium]